MTAAFTERDWDRIARAANEQFVWAPMASVKQARRAAFGFKRAEQVQRAFDSFRDVMESSNPPGSKEEAIRQIVGLIGKLLAVIFPQYALLIVIIGFLWDVSTGTQSTISGVAVGASEGRV